jgi:hypothetical protein
LEGEVRIRCILVARKRQRKRQWKRKRRPRGSCDQD